MMTPPSAVSEQELENARKGHQDALNFTDGHSVFPHPESSDHIKTSSVLRQACPSSSQHPGAGRSMPGWVEACDLVEAGMISEGSTLQHICD